MRRRVTVDKSSTQIWLNCWASTTSTDLRRSWKTPIETRTPSWAELPRSLLMRAKRSRTEHLASEGEVTHRVALILIATSKALQPILRKSRCRTPTKTIPMRMMRSMWHQASMRLPLKTLTSSTSSSEVWMMTKKCRWLNSTVLRSSG